MGEAALARFTLEEIRQQYGESTPRRQFLFRRLQPVARLRSETGHLRHLYLFGSFTTAKPTPGDLDCLAVMAAGFTTVHLPAHLLDVFQHDLCRLYYHADMFWVTEHSYITPRLISRPYGVSWKRLVRRTPRSTISAWPPRLCPNCKSDSRR
jgi:hypothetical protein